MELLETKETIVRHLPSTTLVLAAVLFPWPLAAQTEAAVRQAVIAHYEAINAGRVDAVVGHHTGEFTGFLFDGGPLASFDSREDQRDAWVDESGASAIGADVTPRDIEVLLPAEDVAVAFFYLDGTFTWPGGRTMSGPWRVTELWVQDGGAWKELHHHDSPLLSESVRQDAATAIEETTHEWAAGYVAGDAAHAASFVTDDGVFVPPNAAPIAGRDSIRRYNERLLDEVSFEEVNVTVDGVRVAGDWAVSQGSWAIHFTANDESLADTTRYVVIWERQPDGAWKAAYDLWNSALPVTGQR